MTDRDRQGEFLKEPWRIADRLHTAAIHLLRRLRVEDADSGLSGPRLSALSVIVFAGPITVGRLAEAEQVRPPTVSRLCRDLEKEGLVERVADPHDGRVHCLKATVKGRELLHRGRRRRVAALASRLSALPPDELDLLARAAESLEHIALPEEHPNISSPRKQSGRSTE